MIKPRFSQLLCKRRDDISTKLHENIIMTATNNNATPLYEVIDKGEEVESFEVGDFVFIIGTNQTAVKIKFGKDEVVVVHEKSIEAQYVIN